MFQGLWVIEEQDRGFTGTISGRDFLWCMGSIGNPNVG